jgi:hypothetical protein
LVLALIFAVQFARSQGMRPLAVDARFRGKADIRPSDRDIY